MSPLAIGIGCRNCCSSATIVALVERAAHGFDRTDAQIFTLDRKAESPAVRDAATHLDLPLIGLSRSDLERAVAGATVRSARVEAAVGVSSVAEAAALAGAGQGARLIVPRMVENGATCAIAIGPESRA